MRNTEKGKQELKAQMMRFSNLNFDQLWEQTDAAYIKQAMAELKTKLSESIIEAAREAVDAMPETEKTRLLVLMLAEKSGADISGHISGKKATSVSKNQMEGPRGG